MLFHSKKLSELQGIELLEFQSKFKELAKLAETMDGDEGRYWRMHAIWRMGEYAKGLDLQLEYEIAMEDELWKAKLLNRIGTINYHSGNLKECIIYCNKSLKLFRKLNFKHGEAEAIYWRGVAESSENKIDISFNDLQRSYEISKEINYRYRMGYSCIYFAEIAVFKGDGELQNKRLNEALDHFRTIEYRRGIGHSLRSLGWYNYQHREYETANQYFEQAYQLQTDVDSNEELAMPLCDLVIINSKINRQIADQYLQALKKIKIDPESWFRNDIRRAEITYLKNSERLKDKFQAMNMLETLLEDTPVEKTLINDSLAINFELLYLLLLEYQYTKENVVFLEIQNKLQFIISKADENGAIFYVIRAKLVKAQLEAINGKFDNAETILTEAMEQAQTIGHMGIIKEIMDTSKSINEDFNEMKALINENASFNERLEKSKLMNYIEKAQAMLSGP